MNQKLLFGLHPLYFTVIIILYNRIWSDTFCLYICVITCFMPRMGSHMKEGFFTGDISGMGFACKLKGRKTLSRLTRPLFSSP